ncbi:MAG: hypothetical protein BGO54_13650 [Sphingobacteriales bacterium 46-32]|nr:MAG: hypothetical protein BGO54_13650 [Sphingobacteriales bacterium 46-32]
MVSMCNDSSEGVTCYKKIKPHIVIADANWTNKIYAIPGTKLIQQLIAYDPAAKIIIATNIYEPDVVEEMKQLKIRGYFYRSMNNILSEIVNCIRDVYEGKECFAD